MTAPVLYALDVDCTASTKREVVFRDRFSVSFFVPFKYQVYGRGLVVPLAVGVRHLVSRQVRGRCHYGGAAGINIEKDPMQRT